MKRGFNKEALLSFFRSESSMEDHQQVWIYLFFCMKKNQIAMEDATLMGRLGWRSLDRVEAAIKKLEELGWLKRTQLSDPFHKTDKILNGFQMFEEAAAQEAPPQPVTQPVTQDFGVAVAQEVEESPEPEPDDDDDEDDELTERLRRKNREENERDNALPTTDEGILQMLKDRGGHLPSGVWRLEPKEQRRWADIKERLERLGKTKKSLSEVEEEEFRSDQ